MRASSQTSGRPLLAEGGGYKKVLFLSKRDLFLLLSYMVIPGVIDRNSSNLCVSMRENFVFTSPVNMAILHSDPSFPRTAHVLQNVQVGPGEA